MHCLAFLLQNQPDPEAIKHMVMIFIALIPVIIAVCLVIVIVPFWFILKKAGFSPWLSLLYMVPFGNLFLYYFLAFAEWKVVPVPQVVWQPQPPFPPPPQYPPQA
jgi:flagellar basal body-associated protein FliL